jgi:glutathione S-transferase
MLRIYHVRGTRSVRVLWLCEELGIPYEVVTVDFSPQYRASAEWRAKNPVGKVPAMTDGDFTMFESGAMVQYLLERHGNGRLLPPPGTPESGRHWQWCWFAEATFARPIGEMVNHRRVFGANASAVVLDEMLERARLCARALDAEVAGRRYLLGDAFTAADIMTGYTLHLGQRVGVLDGLPHLAAYFARLAERPGYRKATA